MLRPSPSSLLWICFFLINSRLFWNLSLVSKTSFLWTLHFIEEARTFSFLAFSPPSSLSESSSFFVYVQSLFLEYLFFLCSVTVPWIPLFLIERWLIPCSRSASGTPAGSTAKKKAAEEDKRKQIKEIIEKIPSDKSALFSFRLEWDLLDTVRHIPYDALIFISIIFSGEKMPCVWLRDFLTQSRFVCRTWCKNASSLG